MLVRLLGLAVLLGLIGCSKPADTLPPLHPVKGTVKRGMQPLQDCLVRFRTEPPDARLIITAATDANGRFEASTITIEGNVRKPGAPEGSYRVTIDLPLGADQSGGGTVELVAPQKVVAGENAFEFDVAKK